MIEKPKAPLNRLIYESDGVLNDFCKKCGSSLKRKFGIFKTKHCVQPECNNYWRKNEQKIS